MTGWDYSKVHISKVVSEKSISVKKEKLRAADGLDISLMYNNEHFSEFTLWAFIVQIISMFLPCHFLFKLLLFKTGEVLNTGFYLRIYGTAQPLKSSEISKKKRGHGDAREEIKTNE